MSIKSIKKFLLILILFSLILPINVGAVEFKNPLIADDFEELIRNLINILFTISLFLAPLMIIVGAFYFLIPDEKGANIETGKKIILYTLIGFIIIIAAQGIIVFLENILIERPAGG